MPSHLVFITLFLGIVSGKQGVELQADPSVASIGIALAGREIARLTQPPWRTEIDLGPELVPRELQAIGYDKDGNEVGRASQVLNLPRPHAELQIVREGDGAQLRWMNVEYTPPKSTRVTFDGAPLGVDRDLRVHFPANADARPHVLSAEMRFADGVIARREAIVEGGEFSDTAETQLTPVLVTETSAKHPGSYEDCFTIDGNPVRTSAVDKDAALVVFIQDPDPLDTIRALDPARRAYNIYTRAGIARLAQLDTDTQEQIFWPVVKQFRSGNAQSLLFEHTNEIRAESGLVRLLTQQAHGVEGPRRYADAVVVAAMNATSGGRRRAVVLVLSNQQDVSGNDPAEVRRYCQSMGVPLFVWSPLDPPGAAAKKWGEIEDISTIDHLRFAAARLRKALAAQRIAWIHADPLSALRVKADERCGFTR